MVPSDLSITKQIDETAISLINESPGIHINDLRGKIALRLEKNKPNENTIKWRLNHWLPKLYPNYIVKIQGRFYLKQDKPGIISNSNLDTPNPVKQVATQTESNSQRGQDFQNIVKQILTSILSQQFKSDFPIEIGSPAKNHKFDLVSETCVCECKAYSWTKSGNVPSAKISHVNEAVFYLSFINDNREHMILMKKATHTNHKETLAEYYYRIYKHLLGNVRIVEVDVDKNTLRIIS